MKFNLLLTLMLSAWVHENPLPLPPAQKNKDDAEFHYRLGIMNLKTNNYFSARQNFIAATTALKENIALDNLIPHNWVKLELLNWAVGECYYKEKNYLNAARYYLEAYNVETEEQHKIKILSQLALSEYFSDQFDSSTVHFQQVEKFYNNDDIDYHDGSWVYYIDWPLYLYHKSEENINKAQQYLIEAYNHIPIDERTEYLKDENHLKNLHKYYYIHEIIETYYQNIR